MQVQHHIAEQLTPIPLIYGSHQVGASVHERMQSLVCLPCADHRQEATGWPSCSVLWASSMLRSAGQQSCADRQDRLSPTGMIYRGIDRLDMAVQG